MVKIRLRRMGAKKAPFYRIVVSDSRSPRDGRFIEQIGTYNPLTEPSEINLDMARVKYWMANGAQPTDTVRKLIKISEDTVVVVAEPVVETAPAEAETESVEKEDTAAETV